ncbi:MAG: aldo/keto reductase [Tepidiformaceae bacterium]
MAAASEIYAAPTGSAFRYLLKPIQLGQNSGLRVSQLCLGTMNFGGRGRGHQGDWTLGLDDARPIFKAAIAHGLFCFDCANVYGLGACERVVGELLRELSRGGAGDDPYCAERGGSEAWSQLVDATEFNLAEGDITCLEELHRPVKTLRSIGSS